MWKATKYLSLSFFIVLAFGCAHPGNPGGGPKDMRPPGIVKSDPPNRSAHFNGNKFSITFDEFIELDNITQKVIISPPMEQMPDFRLKGKSLQVKFNEPLKDSTTYSVYFADAIVDITEKNPLLNYAYIFSTGPKVDSLSLLGSVINSFDLTPVESASVLLYKDNNDTLELDSMPFKVIPYYVSKTSDKGEFQFNGLSNDKYLLFALKDLNANYIYDQPEEDIAFIDSLVPPYYIQLLDLDSLRADTSMFVVSDTLEEKTREIVRDSLIHEYVHRYESKFLHHNLSMFNEADSTQRFLKGSVIRKNIIQFAFAWPAENINIEPVNFNPDTSWHIEIFSPARDTINWILKDLPVDTLEVYVSSGADSMAYLYLTPNATKARAGQSKRQQKKAEEEISYLEFQTNIKGGTLPLDKEPELTFYYPIREILSDSILLVSGEDSLYAPSNEFIDPYKRKIRFPIVKTEDTRYTLQIPDSAFIDWNGEYNRHKTVRFTTKSLRDYGIFVIHFKPVQQQPYIFQLLDEKQKRIEEYYFHADTVVTINYLDPKIYTVKLIFDNNGNKKWDGGNFWHKIQPEKVLFYDKKIEVRANWEIDEEWAF